MLVTTPFLLLLLDYWPLKRLPASLLSMKHPRNKTVIIRCIVEKMPLFIPVIASSLITVWVQKIGGPVVSDATHAFPVRLANALASYLKYVYKMIWPVDMAIFYPYPGKPPWWQILAAGLFVLFLSFLSIRYRKDHSYLIVGWLWYIGTLAPVIGIVQVGSQSMADRYTYIPLIGIFVIIAWGIPDLISNWHCKKTFLFFAALISVFICMFITWNQTKYWKNSITLYRHALDVTDNNFLVHHNLGVALAEQRKYTEALKHYSETLRISPDYVTAHYNIGIALAAQGRTIEAIKKYHDVVRLRPTHPKVYFSLGNAMIASRKFNEALKYFNIAVKINPNYAEAHNNLGVVLFRLGHIEKALTHFYRALSLKHDYMEAINNLNIVTKNIRSKR